MPRATIAHPWDVSPTEAREIQERLRPLVRVTPLENPPHTVAGVDVSVKGSRSRAAIVIHEYPTMRPIRAYRAEMNISFPYVPGLLAFREGPVVLKALRKALEGTPPLPDVLMFDAQGLAHPRHFGLACHLGVLLDLPSIGCAKSHLWGQYTPPGERKGSWTPLSDGDEIIGAVVRTRDRVRPVFVSVGHRVDLEAAVDLVLRCTTRYRLPEPTRQAHRVAGDTGKLPFPVETISDSPGPLWK